jgi:hypothetical protein
MPFQERRTVMRHPTVEKDTLAGHCSDIWGNPYNMEGSTVVERRMAHLILGEIQTKVRFGPAAGYGYGYR